MKTRLFLLLVLSFIAFGSIYAQKKNKKTIVSGYVTDGIQMPVAGAVVMVNGEKSGRLTNGKGYYKIKIKPDVTKIGIFTYTNGVREEPVNGRETINFVFEGSVPDQNAAKAAQDGEETVNIGYGSVKKRDVTGSVGGIDGTKSRYAAYSNIYDMLRGEVAGVQVVGTSIKIQNASSLTLSTEPLFVVDGNIVSSISDISPSTVKRVQVLKGSSASIYGSRGANGVILISTLTGGAK